MKRAFLEKVKPDLKKKYSYRRYLIKLKDYILELNSFSEII